MDSLDRCGAQQHGYGGLLNATYKVPYDDAGFTFSLSLGLESLRKLFR